MLSWWRHCSFALLSGRPRARLFSARLAFLREQAPGGFHRPGTYSRTSAGRFPPSRHLFANKHRACVGTASLIQRGRVLASTAGETQPRRRIRIRWFLGSAVIPKRHRNGVETIPTWHRNGVGSGAGKMSNSEEINDFTSGDHSCKKCCANLFCNNGFFNT